VLLLANAGAGYAFWPFSKADAPAPVPESSPPVIPAPPTANKGEDFQAKIAELADQLLISAAANDFELTELPIFATTFADLNHLDRTSPFGRYLAEQLMSELQARGCTIIELRKTTTIMVKNQEGEYGLSRDANELEKSLTAEAMLTGTYLVADDNVLVNARVISNRYGSMLASAPTTFAQDTLVKSMLRGGRPRTGTRPPTEVLYMKKLAF